MEKLARLSKREEKSRSRRGSLSKELKEIKEQSLKKKSGGLGNNATQILNHGHSHTLTLSKNTDILHLQQQIESLKRSESSLISLNETLSQQLSKLQKESEMQGDKASIKLSNLEKEVEKLKREIREKEDMLESESQKLKSLSKQ